MLQIRHLDEFGPYMRKAFSDILGPEPSSESEVSQFSTLVDDESSDEDIKEEGRKRKQENDESLPSPSHHPTPSQTNTPVLKEYAPLQGPTTLKSDTTPLPPHVSKKDPEPFKRIPEIAPTVNPPYPSLSSTSLVTTSNFLIPDSPSSSIEERKPKKKSKLVKSQDPIRDKLSEMFEERLHRHWMFTYRPETDKKKLGNKVFSPAHMIESRENYDPLPDRSDYVEVKRLKKSEYQRLNTYCKSPRERGISPEDIYKHNNLTIPDLVLEKEPDFMGEWRQNFSPEMFMEEGFSPLHKLLSFNIKQNRLQASSTIPEGGNKVFTYEQIVLITARRLIKSGDASLGRPNRVLLEEFKEKFWFKSIYSNGRESRERSNRLMKAWFFFHVYETVEEYKNRCVMKDWRPWNDPVIDACDSSVPDDDFQPETPAFEILEDSEEERDRPNTHPSSHSTTPITKKGKSDTQYKGATSPIPLPNIPNIPKSNNPPDTLNNHSPKPIHIPATTINPTPLPIPENLSPTRNPGLVLHPHQIQSHQGPVSTFLGLSTGQNTQTPPNTSLTPPPPPNFQHQSPTTPRTSVKWSENNLTSCTWDGIQVNYSPLTPDKSSYPSSPADKSLPVETRNEERPPQHTPFTPFPISTPFPSPLPISTPF